MRIFEVAARREELLLRLLAFEDFLIAVCVVVGVLFLVLCIYFTTFWVLEVVAICGSSRRFIQRASGKF